jgi:hypothetical protein
VMQEWGPPGRGRLRPLHHCDVGETEIIEEIQGLPQKEGSKSVALRATPFG